MTNSPHLRPRRQYVLTLPKKQHDYRPGMQHRSRHEAQASNVDTFVFFLQNDKGGFCSLIRCFFVLCWMEE
jgi:hypothetical protein